eukprot:scaffold324993_cov70-Tisochrysis_lutea.AAC.2
MRNVKGDPSHVPKRTWPFELLPVAERHPPAHYLCQSCIGPPQRPQFPSYEHPQHDRRLAEKANGNCSRMGSSERPGGRYYVKALEALPNSNKNKTLDL